MSFAALSGSLLLPSPDTRRKERPAKQLQIHLFKFADGMKVTKLGDYLGLSRWFHHNHNDPKKQETQVEESERVV